MLPNEYLIPPFANEAAFLVRTVCMVGSLPLARVMHNQPQSNRMIPSQMEQLMDARVVPRDSVPRRDPPSPCLTVCGQPCASPCRTERKSTLRERACSALAHISSFRRPHDFDIILSHPTSLTSYSRIASQASAHQASLSRIG